MHCFQETFVCITTIGFFLFFAVYHPEVFGAILRWLPWRDGLEKGILVITGLVIAVVSSTAIVHVLVKTLQKMAR